MLVEDVAGNLPQLAVHLPDNVECPECGEVQAHITFCLKCGAAWMGSCGHGNEVVDGRHQGIDLKQLRRTRGDGYLHVVPLEPDERA